MPVAEMQGIEPADLAAGTEIDEYTLGDGVFKGGMSTLRTATSSVGKKVMVKFFIQESSYQRELSSLLALQEAESRNVISLIDYFEAEEEDEWFPQSVIILELGIVSLQHWAHGKRPVSEVYLKPILLDILGGLESMYAAGLVHCDLKPGNIMQFACPGREQGIWKLIDFDCACKVGQPVRGLTLDYCAPEVLHATRAGKSLMATHALDMFSCGQIIHWMASSTPIWGEEEATDAVMAHMLCQDSELPIFSSTFTQLPVYHLVVELLRKDPAKRLTLKALRKKSYFQSTLDTRVVSDLLKQRLAIEDIDTDEDEEGGAGTVMIPEENDSIFINFSRYVRHRGLRRIWSTNGWGRQISRDTLVESLKNYLAADTTALEAVDGFMDKFLPISLEDNLDAAAGDPVTIERINQAFPKIVSKCQLGDWILHQVHLKSQSRIYM
ncbi:kinase-like domain-containing protein [Piptocephalis cylindrospora]|uniref:Kinase-like domain-containing protein n=1 Tax=Piptocephalis cylindrospora TaxID=1907219 RepID=A0A4P9Y4Y5_9FUNG|nr:kinase-like domain-containing protein [Piptocephalis cylindrospora]|eukprot:RKP14017.1 kinase-like domain-containing protein [Piptocephalis cylindrospora]